MTTIQEKTFTQKEYDKHYDHGIEDINIEGNILKFYTGS